MSRPRLVSDEQILDTVRASVREHGPKVSLDSVAAKLGVTQPALLKRFGSRQSIMLAALMPPTEPPWVADLKGGPDSRPIALQLEELAHRLTTWFGEIVPCMSALRESGIPHAELIKVMKAPPPFVVALRAITQWLEHAEQLGLLEARGVDLESVAASMIGALSSRAHLSHLLQRSWTRRKASDFASDVATVFARALAPAAGASRSRAAPAHRSRSASTSKPGRKARNSES